MTRPGDALIAYAEAKLARIDERNLRRTLKPTRRGEGGSAERAQADLVSFSDNDYLGLSQDARVRRAAADAALAHGAGAGASRLVTGDCPLNSELEARLARMKGTEAALVFGSGYLANVSAIPVLAGPGDLVLLDELAHACMFAGAQLSGARVETFRHNDVADAERLLAGKGEGQALLLTETVFSMDGDRAPLGQLAEICEAHGAWLMTDDAHGFGVLHEDNSAPIQMGTLSKAVGSYGGYICGARALIDLLVNRSRGLIFTTGLPPAALGAAIAALDIIEAEPGLGDRALANAGRFCAAIGAPPPGSAVVPVILGEAATALAASERLLEAGLLVTAIRYPTVPEGTARLRISFSATHRPEDVDRLAQAVKPIIGQRAA